MPPMDIISERCRAYYTDDEGDLRHSMIPQTDHLKNGCYAPLGGRCPIHTEAAR